MNQDAKMGAAVMGAVCIAAYVAMDFFVDTGADIFYGSYGNWVFAVLTGAVGRAKGRSFLAWAAGGLWFVLGALIVALVVRCLPSDRAKDDEVARLRDEVAELRAQAAK